MTTPKPKLVTFAASHFCEKARWALDWHGISYEEVGWPPGLHQILAKRAGARATTVPMVLEADNVIQGSGNIIDWAEKKDRNQDRSLTPKAHSALLAFFAQPNKFSPHHAFSGPESFVSDLDRWSKRPVMAWVRRQYEMHRTT